MLREHHRFLDGLRGLAILGVITVHVSQSVNGLSPRLVHIADYGSHGVQLFFVVSGFTLMTTYVDRAFNARDFFTRRFFRIAPMFYATAVFYLLLGLWTDLRFATKDAGAMDVVLTAFFLHGWLPSTYNRIVPGGWSIAAEMMFYALFPFLLHVASRGWKPFVVLTLLSFPFAVALKLTLVRTVPGDANLVAKFAFFFWLVQLPAFLIGCAVAMARPVLPLSTHGARIGLGLTLLGLCITATVRQLNSVFFADLFFGILIACAALAPPAFLTTGMMTRLGQVSFSVYLVHFLFVGIADRLMPTIEQTMGSPMAFVLTFTIVLLASVTAAGATYRWIELPMIEFGRRRSRHSLTPG